MRGDNGIHQKHPSKTHGETSVPQWFLQGWSVPQNQLTNKNNLLTPLLISLSKKLVQRRLLKGKECKGTYLQKPPNIITHFPWVGTVIVFDFPMAAVRAPKHDWMLKKSIPPINMSQLSQWAPGWFPTIKDWAHLWWMWGKNKMPTWRDRPDSLTEGPDPYTDASWSTIMSLTSYNYLNYTQLHINLNLLIPISVVSHPGTRVGPLL